MTSETIDMLDLGQITPVNRGRSRNASIYNSVTRSASEALLMSLSHYILYVSHYMSATIYLQVSGA